MLGCSRLGYVRFGYFKLGQVRLGYVKSGLVRLGQAIRLPQLGALNVYRICSYCLRFALRCVLTYTTARYCSDDFIGLGYSSPLQGSFRINKMVTTIDSTILNYTVQVKICIAIEHYLYRRCRVLLFKYLDTRLIIIRYVIASLLVT